jgi:phage major head subunit gpT-like protein
VRVTLDEIRRDQTAQVQARINELADRAASHPASLISTLILNGATGLCYDGQYFFDTDHTEGDNTTNQSNSITFDISDGGAGGTTMNPTNLTMQRAILAGVAAIMGFKDDQNEPVNEMLNDFVVMTPPPLMAQGLAATVGPVSDSGATNLIVAQNEFRVRAVTNARLTWTDKFAIFATGGTQKPFINQVEQDTTLSAKAEGSDFEHDNDAHEYGVKRIGNAAYGDWKKACLVTLQA